MEVTMIIGVLLAVLVLPPLLAIIGFWLYLVIYGFKFYFYLMNNYYERWEELTTLGKFGPGANNPFRWLPYLYNDLDTGDLRIRRYKNKIRSGLRMEGYSILVFVFSFFLFLFVAAIVEDVNRLTL